MKTTIRQLGKCLLLLLFLVLSCNKEELQPVGDPLRRPISEFLSAPLEVTVDPGGLAPLTAMLTIAAREACHVKVEVTGKTPLTTSMEAFDTEHQAPVLGLYPDTPNTVILTLTGLQGHYAVDTLTIRPAPLPANLPGIEILTAQTSRMEPGLHLAELHQADNGRFSTRPIIFDNEGTIRWILDLEPVGDICWPIRRLANGNLCFGTGISVIEYDLLGRRINRWDFPGYSVHHEVIELPNGNFIVAVNKSGATITVDGETMPSMEDHIIEIDRASGAIVQEWDLRPLLDVSRTDLINGYGDWFHMNGIAYSEADDSFILSGRNQGVVKINRDNQLQWILAPHRGWGAAGADGNGFATEAFLLTAVDANGLPLPAGVQQGHEWDPAFEWPWGQHAPLLLPNGNIFLFDNGFRRHFLDGTSGYSRGVEYQVDEGAMTVQQVWEYGSSRSATLFAPIISDVDYLPETGNRLIVAGIIDPGGSKPNTRIVEVSYPAGEVVFEAVLHHKNAGGSGEFSWGQFDIVYRGERTPLVWKEK